MPVLPGVAEGRPSVRLGRKHEGEIEIHYRSGNDAWWYQGNVRVAETKTFTTQQVSAEIHDPSNRTYLKLFKMGWPDEKIIQWKVQQLRQTEPDWIPRKEELDALGMHLSRLRYLAQHANDPHVVHFYTLDKASKSEERILAFVDQDPVNEAPQVRYTETEKGWRHKQLVIMAGMSAIDVLFLFGMLTFASAPVSTGQQAQQISAQATANLTFLLIAAGWAASIIALYMVMARRTLVGTWEIEPMVHSSLDAHSEAVYLKNSQLTPSSSYLARVLGYSTSTISAFTTAVAKFQADTISTHQEQAQSLRDELDDAEIAGVETWATRVDLRSALGSRRPTVVSEAGTSLWLIVGIVVTIGIVASVAAVLLAGG